MLSIKGTIAEGVDDCTNATSLSKPLMLSKYKIQIAIRGEIINLIVVAITTTGIKAGLKIILDNCKPITNVSRGIAPRLIKEILFIKLSGNLIISVVIASAISTDKNMGIFIIFFMIPLLPWGELR